MLVCQENAEMSIKKFGFFFYIKSQGKNCLALEFPNIIKQHNHTNVHDTVSLRA